MKKILSIFSIGAILGSGTILSGGGIACGSKPTPPPGPTPKPTPTPPKQLKLKNLQIFDIPVSKNSNSLTINGQSAYTKVEEEIIQEYKAIFPSSSLNIDNFNPGSLNLTKTKTWGVEIMNIDTSTPIANLNNQALNFSSGYTTLRNNALNIQITTSDKNVTDGSNTSNGNASGIVKGYLNKFIYTNKNANSSHDVNATIGQSATDDNLIKGNVIDFSSGTYNLDLGSHLNYNSAWSGLETGFFASTNKVLISKAIVTNLNKELTNETKKLNQLDRLTIANNDVQAADALTINATNTKLFAVEADSKVYALESGNLGSKWKIFAQIDISSWNYLNNYIGVPNTYVYGYLGSVSENTAKFNLNDLAIYDIGGLSLDNENNGIDIDGATAYQEVVNQIVDQNNTFFWSEPSKWITTNDFTLGSKTLSDNKSWAIQLTNGTGEVDARGKVNLGIANNLGLASNNNSLNLHIVTNDVNVSNTTSSNNIEVDVPAYLNKFVFNNQDANHNQNLVINTTDPQPEFDPHSVIDFSNKEGGRYPLSNLAMSGSNTVTQLLNSIENSPANELTLTNAVIDNLNTSYDEHITDQTLQRKISQLQHLNAGTSPYVIKNNPAPGSEQILNIYIRRHKTGTEPTYTFENVDGTQQLANAQHPADVYMQIKIWNWSYLSADNNKYITIKSTCVYAYLGIAK